MVGISKHKYKGIWGGRADVSACFTFLLRTNLPSVYLRIIDVLDQRTNKTITL